MTRRIRTLLDVYCFGDDDVIVLDDLDDCILGMVEVGGRHVLCYCVSKIVEKLCKRDGMDLDDAVDFFEFNIRNLHAGNGSPVFLEK